MVTVDEIKELYKRAEYDYKDIHKRESQIDILESQILHYIEVGTYNAAQGSMLLKKLREVRNQRRIIKDQARETQCVYDRLKKLDVSNISFKKTNPYAVSLDEILNAKVI